MRDASAAPKPAGPSKLDKLASIASNGAKVTEDLTKLAGQFIPPVQPVSVLGAGHGVPGIDPAAGLGLAVSPVGAGQVPGSPPSLGAGVPAVPKPDALTQVHATSENGVVITQNTNAALEKLGPVVNNAKNTAEQLDKLTDKLNTIRKGILSPSGGFVMGGMGSIGIGLALCYKGVQRAYNMPAKTEKEQQKRNEANGKKNDPHRLLLYSRWGRKLGGCWHL